MLVLALHSDVLRQIAARLSWSTTNIDRSTDVQVYKARWHGTLVAVKALSSNAPADKEAFEDECAILQDLHHTHVVHHFFSGIGDDGTVK